MAYRAMVYNVMIACPGDVDEEKVIAKEVIHDWNAAHSESKEIILQPVEWRTHSTPEMGSPAQAIINRQVLAKSDLLVAIFGTRVGSPTGRALSGTVEEIEEQMQAGKPVMVYFSDAPVPRDAVGDASQLAEFEARFKAKGLCESYSDKDDFRAKFTRHLAAKINSHSRSAGIGSPDVEVRGAERPSSIGDDAKELLIEASQGDGRIKISVLARGQRIYTDNRSFSEPGNRREEARWEAALRELMEKDLVRQRGTNGQIFELTDAGFKLADKIRPDSSTGDSPRVTNTSPTGQDLEDIKVKILQALALARDPVEAESVARHLNQKVVFVEFHLEELVERGYVHGNLRFGAPKTYALHQRGREYLVFGNLV